MLTHTRTASTKRMHQRMPLQAGTDTRTRRIRKYQHKGEGRGLTLGVLLPGHLEELTDVSGLLRLRRKSECKHLPQPLGRRVAGVQKRGREREMGAPW
jgi:hypothetical protein